MDAVLITLTLTLAAVDWLAVELHWRRVNFFAKPGVMLALIAWFSLDVGWAGAGLWFGLGLVFSLLGDLLLMAPERWFLPGLASFLLAHICYIAGFNRAPLPLHPLELGFLAGILFLDFWMMRKLFSKPEGRGMALPLVLYLVVISGMAFSALTCLVRPEWSRPGALAVGLGAVLFLVSDSVLAYNKFVAPTRQHDLVVMATYHLAQIGIVTGLILKS